MDPMSDMAVFVRVVAAGGLSAAARELGLSPAMVSKRLSRLEARLGGRLLNRTTRRLHLTEEGARYHERAAQILAEVEEAEALVGAGRATPRGTLRVSVPAAFGRQHVAPLIRAFAERHPELRIYLDLDERIVDLVEGGFDVAVRIAELEDSALVARKLAPNRRVVCASPEYLRRMGTPRSPADLPRHNCLIVATRDSRHDLWPFSGPDGAQTVRVHGTLASNNGEVIRQWALDGLGLALKSTWDVGEDLRAGRLKPVLAEHVPGGMSIYAVYPHRQYLPAKVKAFVDFLQEAYGPEPYWDRGCGLDRPSRTKRRKG
ncbi:MAG: LysR family transcriptional regulator [Pseudomonadota bacterium]